MAVRTDKGTFAEKKSLCVSAGSLKYGEFDGTNKIEIINIPEKSLIRKVYVINDEISNSGVTLKVVVGTTTVVPAAVLTTADLVTVSGSQKILSGSGATVEITPSAALTKGSFTIIVEYIEYTLSTKTLTSY